MMNPGAQSGRLRRLPTMSIMIPSDTYWPAARIGWPLRPSSVPAWISALSMSPVAMCGMPKCERSMLAWVPLPLPGAPYKSRFTQPLRPFGPPPHTVGRSCLQGTSLDETAVLTHHQLRLQLLHRVEGDAHEDQDRSASEIHLLLIDARDLRRRDGQDDRDEPEEDRAHESDPVHHRLQVVRGGTSRADARDEARIAFEVVRDLMHVERDRGVEVREPKREQEIETVVGDGHRHIGGTRAEVALHPVGRPVVPRGRRRRGGGVGDDRRPEHPRDREDGRGHAPAVEPPRRGAPAPAPPAPP